MRSGTHCRRFLTKTKQNKESKLKIDPGRTNAFWDPQKHPSQKINSSSLYLIPTRRDKPEPEPVYGTRVLEIKNTNHKHSPKTSTLPFFIIITPPSEIGPAPPGLFPRGYIYNSNRCCPRSAAPPRGGCYRSQTARFRHSWDAVVLTVCSKVAPVACRSACRIGVSNEIFCSSLGRPCRSLGAKYQ